MKDDSSFFPANETPTAPAGETAATPHAAEPPRQRGRKPGKPLSEAELATRRANLAKAHAAPKELIYRSTAKRKVASRANMAKAIAARKSPEGNAAARLNALKHGLFAKKVLPDSVTRLGENPEEFQQHVKVLEEVFRPQDDLERKLVQRVAETTWRRLRLYLAQALREREALAKLLASLSRPERLTPEQTADRAFSLIHVLVNYGDLLSEAMKLQSKIEWALRYLVKKRSGGKISLPTITPRRLSKENWEDLGQEEVLTLLRSVIDEKLAQTQAGQEKPETPGGQESADSSLSKPPEP